MEQPALPAAAFDYARFALHLAAARRAEGVQLAVHNSVIFEEKLHPRDLEGKFRKKLVAVPLGTKVHLKSGVVVEKLITDNPDAPEGEPGVTGQPGYVVYSDEGDVYQSSMAGIAARVALDYDAKSESTESFSPQVFSSHLDFVHAVEGGEIPAGDGESVMESLLQKFETHEATVQKHDWGTPAPEPDATAAAYALVPGDSERESWGTGDYKIYVGDLYRREDGSVAELLRVVDHEGGMTVWAVTVAPDSHEFIEDADAASRGEIVPLDESEVEAALDELKPATAFKTNPELAAEVASKKKVAVNQAAEGTAASPARSPTGKIRNIKQMGDTKLNELTVDMVSYAKADPAAAKAVWAEQHERGNDKLFAVSQLAKAIVNQATPTPSVAPPEVVTKVAKQLEEAAVAPDSPVRSPTGKIRNLKAMGQPKLDTLTSEMVSYVKVDPDGAKAVRDEQQKRGNAEHPTTVALEVAIIDAWNESTGLKQPSGEDRPPATDAPDIAQLVTSMLPGFEYNGNLDDDSHELLDADGYAYVLDKWGPGGKWRFAQLDMDGEVEQQWLGDTPKAALEAYNAKPPTSSSVDLFSAPDQIEEEVASLIEDGELDAPGDGSDALQYQMEEALGSLGFESGEWDFQIKEQGDKYLVMHVIEPGGTVHKVHVTNKGYDIIDTMPLGFEQDVEEQMAIVDAQEQAAAGLPAGLPKLAADSLLKYEQANKPTVKPAAGTEFEPTLTGVDQHLQTFFNSLDNGDTAQAGSGEPMLVTVVDNQIPGQGIMVEDEDGNQFVAYAGELTPAPQKPLFEQPVTPSTPEPPPTMGYGDGTAEEKPAYSDGSSQPPTGWAAIDLKPDKLLNEGPGGKLRNVGAMGDAKLYATWAHPHAEYALRQRAEIELKKRGYAL